ncbi:MAG: hypothetical protein IJL34_03690, partial [Treponema sp.]|nr:hypothetical protein [Treponema sp.]
IDLNNLIVPLWGKVYFAISFAHHPHSRWFIVKIFRFAPYFHGLTSHKKKGVDFPVKETHAFVS